MKTFKISFLLIALLTICLQSCVKDKCEGELTYSQFTPVYVTVDDIRKDIQIEAPRALKRPGKMYFIQNYILLNEFREGLHVIDNQDPANPQKLAFIKIPGNMDMAVKGNILYADNYIDLLSIDISDPANAFLHTRTEDVFPSLSLDEDLGHLVYYNEEVITDIVPCDHPGWAGGNWFVDDVVFAAEVDFDNSASTSSGGSTNFGSTGQGGSMARFTLVDSYLYTVTDNGLNSFDISDAINPNLTNNINIGWGIETIYPFGNNLFIGSQSGMFIYGIDNPAVPAYRGEFQHARACDPVVVRDDVAYVTLRGGTPCEGFDNQLDVIDVSNVTNPTLMTTYQMDNPYGLAITNDEILYVCDGDSGLRVYNAEDPMDLNQIHHESGLPTYDVIALANDVVLVVGRDGLYQYDAKSPTNLVELSVIPVE